MRDLVLFIPHLHFTLGNIAGLLTLISFLYYIWVLVIRITSTKGNNFNHTKPSSVWPPEVAGRWPIVGHLPQLVGSTPLFRILGDMSEKYGPIFMVRFGLHPTLVVSNWGMSKECFATNDKFLASRPSSAAGKHLTFAMFAFSIYGPYWREIRKITTHELLSPRRLELLNHVRYSEIDNFVKTLYQRWMKIQNQINQSSTTATTSSAGSVKTDMTQMFGELTLTVALKMVVGKPLIIKNDDTEQEDDRNNDEEQEGQKLYKTIIEFFVLAGVSVASDILPFLGWLDLDGQKRNMKKVARKMDFFAKKWLEEHRQKKVELSSVEGSNKDDAGDFMDMLILLGETYEIRAAMRNTKPTRAMKHNAEIHKL